jgi:hypothetical protein
MSSEKDIERDLCTAVEAGEPYRKRGIIPAETLRALVLARPLKYRTRLCPLTRAGIVIEGATIDRRLELDRVIIEDGTPLPPLEFRNCTLLKGFSGAHGHFSRLSFVGCAFGRPDDVDGRPVPTIDLSDAHIDTDLDMAGIAPIGYREGSGWPKEDQYLWITAVGARVNGKVELSRCRLRAPVPGKGHRICDEAEAALNLTLAHIKGDLRLLSGARCDGRIKLRGGHVEGDVWLRGATVRSGKDEALFFQGARIGGFLMLDGGFDKSDQEGDYRRFRCKGELNLRSVEVGRSLFLNDAMIEGDLEARDIDIGDDFFLGAAITGDVDLTGARIGGTLDMPDLNLAPWVKRFTLRDAIIGRSLKLVPGHANYELASARRIDLTCLPGVELIEGLWCHGDARMVAMDERVTEDYWLAQTGFLRHRGQIWPLDGRASIFDRVIDTVGHRIDEDTAEEYLRLYCRWHYGGRGLFDIQTMRPDGPVQLSSGQGWAFHVTGLEGDIPSAYRFAVLVKDKSVIVKREAPLAPKGCACAEARALENEEPSMNAPRFVGGLLLLPRLSDAQRDEFIRERRWFAPPTFGEKMHVETPDDGRKALKALQAALRPHVQHRILLAGSVDLENLNCDMLDDQTGRAWGGDFQGLDMNHFVYRRTSWAWGDDHWEKPTHKRFLSWFARNWVEWVWPHWMHWPKTWRRRALNWEPWQRRRSWIYRQYRPKIELPYLFRYRINEHEYRPQPFEQAIRVARAEGRENFAINFEMLKHKIEWRLFNLRSRWWLGGLGFAAAYGWALFHGGNPVLVGIAFAATMALLLWASFVHKVLSKALKWQWAHHSAHFVSFILPGVFLYFADDWGSRPLHFVIAVILFAVIRSMSWVSDLVLRGGFGYLRRPLRALVTLTFAFLVGWVGVVIARGHNMLVVDVEPVADAVIEGQPLMGSVPDPAAARDIVCNDTLVAPLYALDVLIPLVDLREESRCEIRRLPGGWEEPAQMLAAARARAKAEPNRPALARDVAEAEERLHALEAPGADDINSVRELLEKLPALTVENHHFWAVLKVLYAIAGWFIVSLALLTFTQVNRTREEALPEPGRR